MLKFCIGCESKYGYSCRCIEPSIENCKIYQMLSAGEPAVKDPFHEVFKRYRHDVNRTAPLEKSEGDFLIEMALGMCKEAGEIAGLIDKAFCQGHPFSKEKLTKEAGDLLFYFIATLNREGITLTDVIEENIKKRRERYPEGFTVKDSIERRDQKE